MKILTRQEGVDWLGNRNFPKNKKAIEEYYENKITCILPKDSGMKTALSRSIVNLLAVEKSEGVFFITDWGVWPSSENKNLFYALRKSFDETREIENAPFHLFEKRDLKDLECLLDLALYFIWTTILISPNLETVIIPTHNEQISVCCKNVDGLKPYLDLFEIMKFEFVKK